MRQFFENAMDNKRNLKMRIYVYKYKFYPYKTKIVVAAMESLEQSRAVCIEDFSGKAISLKTETTIPFCDFQFTGIDWTGEYYEDDLCGSIKYN